MAAPKRKQANIGPDVDHCVPIAQLDALFGVASPHKNLLIEKFTFILINVLELDASFSVFTPTFRN